MWYKLVENHKTGNKANKLGLKTATVAAKAAHVNNDSMPYWKDNVFRNKYRDLAMILYDHDFFHYYIKDYEDLIIYNLAPDWKNLKSMKAFVELFFGFDPGGVWRNLQGKVVEYTEVLDNYEDQAYKWEPSV